MKTIIYTTLFVLFCSYNANAQCHYIRANQSSPDTLAYTFIGGTMGNYGCAPLDTTYWMTGIGDTVKISFLQPQSHPKFRVWGMNDDDSASVYVNGSYYYLDSSSASYSVKDTCGLSPGANGIVFYQGYIAGVNTNPEGNYSYQDVMLNDINVNSLEIISFGGAGWGFAGVTLNCDATTAVAQIPNNTYNVTVFPNPASSSATLQTDHEVTNASLALYNIYGQKVKTQNNLSGTKATIDCSNLPAGIYTIRLTQQDGSSNVQQLTVVK